MSDRRIGANRIVLAGATGGLGGRIAAALSARGAEVTALVRPGSLPERLTGLRAAGVRMVEADPDDVASLAAACAGAACVVSALNGLTRTILGTQARLLDAAVAAGVPRFIPSDFSLDFTRTADGSNRNLDLRRDFHRRLDRARIGATSILNGGFMELLDGQAPIILFPIGQVLCWGDPEQPLDFTTMDDVAAYTAAAALDPAAPRILRIAGDQISARGLAEAAGEATGRRFRTLRVGDTAQLRTLIRIARRVAPGRGQVFPPFQGMQYLRDMFSGEGKLAPLDTARYPGMGWTDVRTFLAARRGPAARRSR